MLGVSGLEVNNKKSEKHALEARILLINSSPDLALSVSFIRYTLFLKHKEEVVNAQRYMSLSVIKPLALLTRLLRMCDATYCLPGVLCAFFFLFNEA